jgi:hypothetical protein
VKVLGGLLAAALSAALVLVLVAVPGAASAAAATPPPPYAPLDQPGPALSVPLAQLQASLKCEPGVKNAKVEPVLLNPATGVTADQNYSWNWEPALDKLGIPWCAYTAPHSTLDDIQTSGEYLVHAIRTMYAMAGRKIAVMGHSQGGMSMRWPLRFWPDTRKLVDDVIGFSGSNHGTTVLGPGTCSDGCPPADWQQGSGSNFIKAINSDAETFPGISYTEIYTHTDEVVQPANNNQDASAALHTGGGAITNVATQDVCPSDVYEHLGIGTIDPVAYAIAVDALTHAGPADLARISKSVCSETVMPGVNPADANTILQIIGGAPTLASVTVGPAAAITAGAPVLKAEPALECYVFATCPATTALTVKATPKHAVVHRRTHLRILVTVDIDGVVSPVPSATIHLGKGRQAHTDTHGRARATVTFARAGRHKLLVSANEYKSGRATIRVAPASRHG